MKNLDERIEDRVFIFAGYADVMMRVLFQDLFQRDDVLVVEKLLPFREYVNGLLRGLVMRLYTHKLCQNGLYLMEKIYRPLERAGAGDREAYILFTNGASIGVSVPYLKSFLRRHEKCVPVMLFMDSQHRYWAKYAKFLVDSIPQFRCFTFDPKDAQENGFQYTMNVYSRHEPAPDGEESDIYFSFFGLDRFDFVREAGDYLKEGHVRCRFVHVGEPAREKSECGVIEQVPGRLDYFDILRDAAASNCLLEILRPGQCGSTLRYYEAVCYNKKLLTTNRNVVNLPFYDPRFMKIFEKPSDIDCEWVRRREPVDYHYDGRFSPVYFLEGIQRIEHERGEANGKTVD